MVLGRYKELIKNLYSEPANENVLGNILEVADLPEVQPPKWKKKRQLQPDTKSKDIKATFKKIKKQNQKQIVVKALYFVEIYCHDERNMVN